MTTADLETHNPSLAQFLLWKFSKAMSSRKAKSKVNTGALTWIQATIRIVLHLAGFGSLTYAGFEWSTIAGFVVAGISCFLLSWLTTGNPPPTDQSTRR